VSMPDVNALMNQRVRGAENIYQIETARQAQAADDEKAAAKAQEDAAVKALLPAYAHAFKTGDMRTALSLAPAEYQDGLLQYVEALDGKPIEEIQAALIGSLSSSPAGQEALSAIQRGQTFSVQSRQQDLAEKRYEAELAAAGQPKPMSAYEEIQSGFREREIALKEQEAAAKATMPEGMDAKTKTKFEQAYPKAASSLRTAVTGMDNTLVALEKLINDPGLKLISGTVGAYTPNINADAKRAQALFDQIKAGAGLAALVELKQASPAGGALGNVSNQEGNTLRDSRGAFLQAQEYEDLKRALIDYYGVLERSKANIVGAFDDTYSYRGENQANSVLQAAQEQFGNIDEQIKQKFPDTSAKPKIRRVR
jgi:hypothetical protein